MKSVYLFLYVVLAASPCLLMSQTGSLAADHYRNAQRAFDDDRYDDGLNALQLSLSADVSFRTRVSYLGAKIYDQKMLSCVSIADCYDAFLEKAGYYVDHGSDDKKRSEISALIRFWEKSENDVWESFQSQRTITAYETYLSSNILKSHKHIGIADTRLRKWMVQVVTESAEARDFFKMEAMYTKFTARYPGDSATKRLRHIIKESYFADAVSKGGSGDDMGMDQRFDKFISYSDSYAADWERAGSFRCDLYKQRAFPLLNSKKEYDLEKAEENLASARKYCGQDENLQYAIKKCKRRLRRFSRPDRSHFQFLTDDECPVGVTMGNINTRGLGYYMFGRLNKHMWNGTIYEVDDNGNSLWDSISWSGRSRRANGEFGLGFTRRIIFPVWFQAGVIVGYYALQEKVYYYYEGEPEAQGTEWAKNTDHSSWKVGLDLGLLFDFKGFNVKAGLKFPDFSDPVVTWGIGFSF